MCRSHFKREEGFFVGAIAISVVTTEAVILFLYFISLALFDTHFDIVVGMLLGVALVFPVAFYHHSWSIWLALDHAIEKLPKVS